DRIFNKITLGDYELGSVFKIFNTAMALDSGIASMTSSYDAAHDIRIGRFTISDYHGKHRWLSVPEIFMYSSNLGSARMAVAAGAERQRNFLARLGILRKAHLELDEIAIPHFPKPEAWKEVSTMTIAYGHGIAVSPLECVTGVAAIVNGGILHPATLLKLPPGAEVPGHRVISTRTSDQMRKLMRLVVEFGTAKFAEAPGYVVGGKTGTAEKNAHGRYEEKKLLSTFIGAFPMTDPRYVILALVDEPHGTKESHGYATAGWTVAPATGRIISRIAPLLGIAPVDEKSPAVTQALPVESLAGKRIENYWADAASRRAPVGGTRFDRSRNSRAYRGFPPGAGGLFVCRLARRQHRWPPLCRRGGGEGRGRDPDRRPRGARPRRPRPKPRRDRRRPEPAAPPRPRRRPVLRPAARDDRRRHRHQRQDLGRAFHPRAVERARPQRGKPRHARARDREQPPARLADDAGLGRAAPRPRRARGGRRRPRRDRGVQPRPRSVPARRRRDRRRGVHQPDPRPPRLPRRHGSLPRRQGAAVHGAAAAARGRGPQREQRRIRPPVPVVQVARTDGDRLWRERGRRVAHRRANPASRRAEPRPRPVRRAPRADAAAGRRI